MADGGRVILFGDDGEAAAVPEPATLALFGAGFAAVALARRRARIGRSG